MSALLADTETAALVAPDGTIGWWCPGRFDARAALSTFADPVGSAVCVAPAAGAPPGVASYVDDSLVLRTRFPAPHGELEVTDLLPWRGPGHRPDGRVVRVVRCLRGVVDVEITVHTSARRDVSTWSGGIAFEGVVVDTGCDMTGRRTGRVRLEAGDHHVVTIGTSRDPLSLDRAVDLVERTTKAWASRIEGAMYDGPYAPTVRRALLTLLALIYVPTGAVVAEPAASPDRYASVRDACAAGALLGDVALDEEADRVASWLHGVCAGASFPLRAHYGLTGDAIDDDALLAPEHHADLVMVAELLGDAAARLGDWLSDRPPPTEPASVAPELARWWALQRLSSLASSRNPLDLAAAGWREEARAVQAWIEAHGFADDGSLRARVDATDPVDTALLQVAWRNPWPHEPWRAERTVDRVLHRLPDERSLEAVRALAALGRWDDAHERMGSLLAAGEPGSEGPRASWQLALVQAATALAQGPP